MAKISPVSIKYMIYASFKATGPLEKPDVIGAIFGQTEGLLGSDLEMRELQKEGKIGRIEVELDIVDGKAVGKIEVPTALDKTETTLIAAALETIDKIGPTEAEIKVDKIEDVRQNKRDYIMKRAKELLEGIEVGSFKEISRSLQQESRATKIQEYGKSRLPCGDISGEEVIVVEGRADVLNLLRNRVYNVIGMDGAKLPEEIIELGNEKKLTLFVDGDRGGKLIAKNAIANANIAYVAVAPDGKEVEELTGKEILMALRKKVPAEEFLKHNGGGLGSAGGVSSGTASAEEKEKLREIYEKIRGTKNAVLLNSDLEVIRKLPAREAAKALKNFSRQVYAVVVDGQASQSLIKVCNMKGVALLAAPNFSDFHGEVSTALVSV
ncbi:DNA primase [Candidatus Pacearchaeota archaeon]|nr:MAG: DNA primase [Candidatus Pacearchaeota archaeon]